MNKYKTKHIPKKYIRKTINRKKRKTRNIKTRNIKRKYKSKIQKGGGLLGMAAEAIKDLVVNLLKDGIKKLITAALLKMATGASIKRTIEKYSIDKFNSFTENIKILCNSVSTVKDFEIGTMLAESITKNSIISPKIPEYLLEGKLGGLKRLLNYLQMSPH